MTTHASVLARAQHALAEFFRLEAAGGILLIAAAVLAMLAANSPLAHAYEVFRDTPLGGEGWGQSLHWWINDGLMAVFFLLVSLEIKREVISGQLSSRDQLVLPVVCAVAGVAAPALLYTAMNHGDAGAMRGWAIPTATDIAKLYPGRFEARPHHYTDGEYLRIPDPAGGTGVLVFETDGRGDDAKVVAWRVGLAPQVDYVEGCS